MGYQLAVHHCAGGMVRKYHNEELGDMWVASWRNPVTRNLIEIGDEFDTDVDALMAVQEYNES